jgi:argininosuccinate lyase
LKGLSSSYQRDLQEDKEPLFAAHDQALAMTQITAGAVGATQINVAKLSTAAEDSTLLATQAAHYLVRRGLPFRQAHEVIGRIVREAERARESWTAMPLSKLKSFSPLFEADLQRSLTLDSALASCDVPGGTAPHRVREALAACHARLEQWTSSIA